MNAVARKSVARLRQALRRAARTGRQLLTAALTTSPAALIRRAATALTGFTAAQLASAAELIEDNGIHPLRGRVWLTVSTDGSRVHRTTAHACSCEAGIKGIRCYHLAAVRALEAA